MRIYSNLERSNKNVNVALIVCFILILLVPVVEMNRAKDQVSEIDNRKLVEFPKLKIGTGFRKGFEAYLSDRIGFRNRMLDAYQKICDVMFMKLVHPIYMYGEEKYVFLKTEKYISDYQHLNINEAYINSCSEYLDNIHQYLRGRDIKFVHFLVPDKKSVYSEFFPPSVNVSGDKSQATMLIDKTKRKGIPYIHPIKEFLEAKKHQQIYNQMFDAGHWNGHGAFLGHSIITQKLQEFFPDVKLLAKSDFHISMHKKTSLPTSHFEITEDTPYYQPKKLKAERIDSFDDLLNVKKHQFVLHQNKASIGKPKLMVFRDSYFNSIWRFYAENFSEIISIHSENLKDIEYFVNIFEPDIVLLENAERVISPIGGLFSKVNMRSTILHDYSDLYLPKTASKAAIGFNSKENGIIVPDDKILTTITGKATVLSTGKRGKALFAKVNGKCYAAKYPSAEAGKETTFSLTLKTDTLRRADKIEFILISSDGKFTLQSVVVPIILDK